MIMYEQIRKFRIEPDTTNILCIRILLCVITMIIRHKLFVIFID